MLFSAKMLGPYHNPRILCVAQTEDLFGPGEELFDPHPTVPNILKLKTLIIHRILTATYVFAHLSHFISLFIDSLLYNVNCFPPSCLENTCTCFCLVACKPFSLL